MSGHPTIDIQGKRLQVVRFRDALYRADTTTFTVGSLGSQNYARAPMKYFTLAKYETDSYSRRGMPFVKTWEPTEELVLIDILHPATRKALKELIGAGNINIAFPEHPNGSIYRVSEENTVASDDAVLSAICNLGVFDGYYMKTQKSRNNGLVGAFHSEVGLCPRGLRKIRLEKVDKVAAAPRVVTHRRRRNNNNNNNTLRGRNRDRNLGRNRGLNRVNNTRRTGRLFMNMNINATPRVKRTRGLFNNTVNNSNNSNNQNKNKNNNLNDFMQKRRRLAPPSFSFD